MSASTKRRPAVLRVLVLVAILFGLAPIACGLLDPFPDLAASALATDAGDDLSETRSPNDASAPDASTEACVVGSKRPCGFEACNGVEECLPDGGFTACDARKPTFEKCATTFDESCDGVGSCTGTSRWARAFGDSLAQKVNAIAIDDDGNVYVVGSFAGDLLLRDADGGRLSGGGATETPDAFLLKLSRGGALLWARSIPDAELSAVGVGKKGVIVGGDGSTVPGCGALTPADGGGLLLVRYDTDGNCEKAAVYGGAQQQTLTGLAVDPLTGDAVAVGVFKGELSLGGPVDGGTDLTSPDSSTEAGFYARFDGTTLAGLHASAIGFTGRFLIRGVAIGSVREAMVVGSFQGRLGLASAAGAQDGFVLTMLPNGSKGGVKQFGGLGVVDPTSVAFDRTDRMIVVGQLSGRIDLPGDSGTIDTSGTPSGGMFLLRVSSPGVTAWEGTWYGDTGSERPTSVTTDPEGNIIVGGELNGHVNVGGGAFVTHDGGSLATNGGDAFVAKYDRDFAFRWGHVFGDHERQRTLAVATDPLGNIFVGGSFEGAADFAGDGKPLNAGVNSDAFVLMRRP